MKQILIGLVLAFMVGFFPTMAQADEIILKREKGVSFAYDIYQHRNGYKVRLVIYNQNNRPIQTDGNFVVYWKGGANTHLNPVRVRSHGSHSYPSTFFFRSYPVYQSWASPAWRFR